MRPPGGWRRKSDGGVYGPRPAPIVRRRTAVGLLAGLWVMLATTTAQVQRAVPPAPARAEAAPLAPARAGVAAAEPAREESVGGGGTGGGLRLKFNATPLDLVLDEYAKQTGKTLLKSPELKPVNISLKSVTDLSLDEYLQAIESVLGMNGVALLKEGEKFIRVVPIASARTEAMPITPETLMVVTNAAGEPVLGPDGKPTTAPLKMPETSQLVSLLIPLKYIDLNEAKKVIEQVKHPYGQIHTLERSNSVLVTDTGASVNRMEQLIQMIDTEIVPREETFVVQIRYTKASEVKKRLEEIIAAYQKDAEAKKTAPRPKDAGQPGVVRPEVPSIPGVIRPVRPSTATQPVAAEEYVEEAERGIIRGTVQIVADDRTNVLIILTGAWNMKFFDKVIKVLDVETAPDVIVRVFRLEYADSESIASMLNDLIGAATAKKDEGKPTGTPADKGGGATGGYEPLRAVQPPETRGSAAVEDLKSKVGQLSKENVKILSDKRTNSLIIMASKGDVASLEEIIKDMDMMLSQVMIEAVILEVNLDDTMETGMNWLQRSMIAYDQTADGARSPIMAFAGAGGAGAAAGSPRNAASLNSAGDFPTPPVAGLQYYFTFFNLNMDAVLKLAASDSHARILSSPIILTTDNKEAIIDVATERYFYKGQRYVGRDNNNEAIYESDVERKKVGINLTVTPRINEKKFVVMTLIQTIDNVSGTQTIEGQDWPIVTTRKFDADIAVRSGDTIVLGGLVLNNETKKANKVPILGDIPILGFAFSGRRKELSRNEVIVFITPYVLDTPEEIMANAIRQRDAAEGKDMWRRGWSGSKLALPPDERASFREKFRKGKVSGQTAATPQAEAAEPTRAPAPEPSKKGTADQMTGANPEIKAFVEIEEQRWDPALKDVDKRVEERMEKP